MNDFDEAEYATGKGQRIHRLLSLLIGGAEFVIVLLPDGPRRERGLFIVIFMLTAAIWFPDEIGGKSPWNLLKNPSTTLRWCGWIGLFLIAMVMLIRRAS